MTSPDREFLSLAEILGYHIADCVCGLMGSESDDEKMYFLSRYIGASRVVRNLNMERNLETSAFHLWALTPSYIEEKYGIRCFYVGSEWAEMDVCQTNTQPKAYYDMLHQVVMGEKE